jgi:hypothetical protein
MGRQCEQQSERRLSKKPKSSNAKEDGTEQEDGTKMSVLCCVEEKKDRRRFVDSYSLHLAVTSQIRVDQSGY